MILPSKHFALRMTKSVVGQSHPTCGQFSSPPQDGVEKERLRDLGGFWPLQPLAAFISFLGRLRWLLQWPLCPWGWSGVPSFGLPSRLPF